MTITDTTDEETQAVDVGPPTTIDGGGEAESGLPLAPHADEEQLPTRLAVALGFPVLGAAVMVGGIFSGASPRFYAAVGGALGVLLGVGVSRLGKRTALSTVCIVVGLFAIGALLTVPNGVGNIFKVHRLAADAASTAHVLRPPVKYVVGWKAITGWLMGTLGFGVAWLAVVVKRPAIALLAPLSVAALAGISVPKNAQVASGLAVLVLFAIGLGLLSSEQAAGDDGTRPPLAFEVRKAIKAIPLLVVITFALYLISKSNFLFPTPQINPAQEPQRPRTQPLSQVQDRVLFEVNSELTGPWRVGSLDVYDGKDWRLPPFAQNKLEEVPKSGFVNTHLNPAVAATFTVKGLSGTVLPDLPNTVGVQAKGPRLAYDSRSGNIRLVDGAVSPGLSYIVAAAGLPTIDDLKTDTDPIPADIRQFAKIGDAPPAAQALIDAAPSGSQWEKFDFLRNQILDNVTATGTGQPIAITADRVQDMLVGSRRGSPFEIVAAQAMMARWIGLPSRIGYGFDGGQRVLDHLEVHPSDGAAFVEVYFPRFEWLPVIGVPKKAEPTVGSDPSKQRIDNNIQPSDDIAVQVFLPLLIPPGSVLGQQIVRTALIALPVIALILLIYFLWPALRKAQLRSRRRDAAQAAGTRARVALAYAEFRDVATDFGFNYPTDTPLMFLDRFADDEEHSELAWLTTRVLWGDLQEDPSPVLATVAEELSRALRRRLASAQPASMRAVAMLSRLSLRDPFAPDTDLTAETPRKEADHVAVPV
jgi:hypothetical protein